MSALLLLTAFALQAAALPRDVPYLPQTEALCGGAAAAMVMRYWGGDARPEDFAPLIDRARDGIVTTALVADLQRRGWQAFPLRGRAGEAGLLREHIARGRPMIALIEDRPSRYHYVVITAVDDARVHFHDPAIAPRQAMTHAEFDRRWRAANFWALLLLPGTQPVEPVEPIEPIEPVEPTDPPLAREVSALLRAGNTDEALRMASEATRADPANAVAWDALATTEFVRDREMAALAAWNRIGRPIVDTVQVSGTSYTRFRPLERAIDLPAGTQLTPGRLTHARRRVALIPSVETARVSYAPLPTRRVQIDAAIVERPRVPGLADLLVAAAKSPFSRDMSLSMTNLVGGGERVTGTWRFRRGFERIEAAVETPALLPLGAVWKISGSDARETFRGRADTWTFRRQRAGFQAMDWLTSSVGWTAAAAFERWPAAEGDPHREKFFAGARAMIAGGSPPGPAFDAHITAEGWMRGDGATRLSGLARAVAPARAGRLTLVAGIEGVHGRTPDFLSAGAGDGHIRAPLLRAHPLVQDGAISVEGGRLFGRRLVHGTIEADVPIARLGLAEIRAAVFTDAARAWQLLDARLSDYQVDAGGGLRVRLLGAGPVFRVDIARGLRDGEWAVTAGTVLGFDRWVW